MATTAPVASASSVMTVGDAKNLVITTYPKLFSRFNFAFNGHEDSTPLVEVVDVIRADVRAWLAAMPDNFKTSNHALSRPKFGLVFVLKHDSVRAALGEAYCASAVALIDKTWDECKKDLVVAKDDAPALESEDELRARLDDLTVQHEAITTMVVDLITKHYDPTIAACFETLLKK